MTSDRAKNRAKTIARRGDMTTPVLLWFAVIAAVLIMVVWYARAGDLMRIGTGSIDEDLTKIHYALSLACTNQGYFERIALNTKNAIAEFNQTNICITAIGTTTNITRCVPQPCDISNPRNMMLGATITINKTITTDKTDDIIVESER